MMQVEAETLGRKLAASCLDYSPDGGLVRVVDIRAVKVLQRFITQMLRGGGQPLVVALTAFEAAGFPRRAVQPDMTGGTPWLAVGLDGQGRATYSLRWMRFVGASRSEVQGLAELAMLAQLAIETGRDGFPMGDAMGRA